jgi:hypothetical protein
VLKRHRQDTRFCSPVCRARWHRADADDKLRRLRANLESALARVAELEAIGEEP